MNKSNIINPITALGLCSGGLDSILAGMLLMKQSIKVKWVCFETPFFNAEKAIKASEQTGIPLITHNLTEDYIKMLKNPRQGYGKNMNPCLDCHALMFKTAGNLMKKFDAQFLFSGEVLGQRPMSQTRPSLNYVEKNSGYKGYILRPLCAKNMQETIPEKNGWVDRSQLLNITGRSRKRQIALAKDWNIADYPNPAGGCLLTDEKYSIRLKDVFDNGPYKHDRDLFLLQWGRHFRINQKYKIIVGRTQNDNEHIIKYYKKQIDILLDVIDYPSPIVLIPYGCDTETIKQAASIAVSYTRAQKNELISVQSSTPEGVNSIKVSSISKDISCQWMV